jgi:hypothetical protein
MSIHVFPRGNDRSWTREFYYAINRLFRRFEYEHRAEVDAEVNLRITNLVIYGISHPEIYQP